MRALNGTLLKIPSAHGNLRTTYSISGRLLLQPNIGALPTPHFHPHCARARANCPCLRLILASAVSRYHTATTHQYMYIRTQKSMCCCRLRHHNPQCYPVANDNARATHHQRHLPHYHNSLSRIAYHIFVRAANRGAFAAPFVERVARALRQLARRSRITSSRSLKLRESYAVHTHTHTNTAHCLRGSGSMQWCGCVVGRRQRSARGSLNTH